MSSIVSPPYLPLIFSVSHHDELYKKHLKKKALALIAASKETHSSSDSDDLGPSIFSTDTKSVESVIPKSPGDVKDVSLLDTASNGDAGNNTAGVGAQLLNSDDATTTSSPKKKSAESSNKSNLGDGSEEWLDPITERDFKLSKLRDAIEKRQRSACKRSCKFRSGRTVSCRRKKVSKSLPKGKRSDGTKNVRGKVFGIILKRSPMCANTWLVKFNNGDSWYIHDKQLVLEKDLPKSIVDALLNKEEKDVMEKIVLCLWLKIMRLC